MVLKGHISSKEDVLRINKVATESNFPIYISVNNEMFDARSFVFLFNFIGRDVNVVTKDGTSAKEFAKAFKRMQI